MNFYPFHIGDYASATRHLSWDEDCAYRRLLDAYYVREGPLPTERRQVYRLVLAASDDQRSAVDTILAEFFTETAEGWRHGRCDVEILAAQDKSAKAAQSARARWGDAKSQDVAMRPAPAAHTDRSANASNEASERTDKSCERDAPKTNPKTNPKEEGKPSSAGAYAPPEWVPPEAWAEFVQMRKAMRNVPFTGAAARGVVAELGKLRDDGHDPAECLRSAVTNGWRTVYPPKGQTATRNGTHAPQRFEGRHAAAGRTLFGSSSDSEVIDVEAR